MPSCIQVVPDYCLLFWTTGCVSHPMLEDCDFKHRNNFIIYIKFLLLAQLTELLNVVLHLDMVVWGSPLSQDTPLLL